MKHRISQCPKARRDNRAPGQQQRQGQQPRQQQQNRRQIAGMAYTINREQADVAANVVKGMILVDEVIDMQLLYYFESICSFIVLVILMRFKNE